MRGISSLIRKHYNNLKLIRTLKEACEYIANGKKPYENRKIFNAYNLSCLLTAIPRPSLENLLKARYAFLSLLHHRWSGKLES